jgi:hypothetical protein
VEGTWYDRCSLVNWRPALPKYPPHFDRREAGCVLRLRFRDWMWPAAIVIAAVIPFLGQSNGPYRIGSLTYYANTIGPPLFLAAIAFAGARWCSIGWCWIGWDPDRDRTHCGHCDYPLHWMESVHGPRCCPECGTDVSSPPTRRAIPLPRVLLDVPGLLAVLFPLSLFAMMLLATLGMIEFD